MSRSPFPGMAQHLEAKWPEAHASLIVDARNQLNAKLPEDLQSNVEENLAIPAADDGDAKIRY